MLERGKSDDVVTTVNPMEDSLSQGKLTFTIFHFTQSDLNNFQWTRVYTVLNSGTPELLCLIQVEVEVVCQIFRLKSVYTFKIKKKKR